jgi:solute carrier family 25 phosphate transporter 23/24/25/41
MATERRQPKSAADEERIRNLFKELDVNKDGHIDAEELNAGLKRLGVPNVPGQAEAVVSLGDQNHDGRIDFDEFVEYVKNHEEKLWVVFKKLDLNQDDQIDKEEMIKSLKKLGIPATGEEVDMLLEKIDSDGNLMITWDEWREFLLLQPHTTVKSILQYWSHATNVNIGEADTIVIPEEFSEEDRITGKWWRQLVAGGGAGAVSRTCTAPLDRLKIFFMVSSMQGQRFTIMSGLRYMLEEGGVRSLWRGNGVNVIKIAPESALRFFAYERVKKLLKDGNEQLKVHERLLAGSTAGVIAQTTIYPLEVMKTRLALGKTGQYRGLMDCARHTLQAEGIRTFYKGLTPSLIGIIPYAGIDLAVYEVTARNTSQLVVCCCLVVFIPTAELVGQMPARP